MNVRHFIASSAMLLLLGAPAFAQPAPSSAPVLGGTSGLSADSSRSPIGFKPPTAANIGDYIKAVGAVEVNAAFHSTKQVKASAVTVTNGADVSLHASYSKKNGGVEPTLDALTLNAKGVNVGPQLGPIGLKFQRAEIHADGSMAVKLNSWIPELKINKVERQPNGDVKLKGSWWMPDCTITKDGDVKVGKVVKIFGHEIGGLKTVGHIDPRLFATWPPTLETVAGILTSGKGPLPEPIKQLAGGLAWDVKADADGLPIEIEGAPLKTKESLHVHGNGNLANGRIATVGSANTVNLKIDIAKQTFDNGKMGITVDKGGMTLDGAYKLDIPLDTKNGGKMTVAFDGKAAYSAEGENLHITLPSGAKVSVANVALSREGDVHFQLDGAKKAFQLDDAHYDLTAKGPIHVEKLGMISSLDLDGELRSQGLSKIRADGLMALNGDLKGSVEVRNSGLLPLLNGQKGFYAKTVKPGSRVDVDLDQLFAAIRLPLDGNKPGFEGADVAGKIGVHGDLGDVSVKKDGFDIAVPDAHADLTIDGRAKIRGTNDISGSGVVTGSLGLPNGGTATVNKGAIHGSTTIDPGSHVDLSATVSRGSSGAAQNERITTTANLNARTAPDTSSQILRVLPKGTELEVLSRQGDWAKVRAADGAEFFVSTKYAATSRPASGGATTNVAGKITGDLGATDATIDAFGAKGDVKAHVHAGIDAPFKATIGPDGTPRIDTKATHATLPIRIDLKRGTKVSFQGNNVTLTDDVCYVQLTGDVALDGNGKPVLTKLSNVEVKLELGAASAFLFGKGINVPGLGTTTFKGDVTFGPNGMQIHGNAATTINGQSAPLFNISF